MDGVVSRWILKFLCNDVTVWSQDHKTMKADKTKAQLQAVAFCGALTATYVEKSV